MCPSSSPACPSPSRRRWLQTFRRPHCARLLHSPSRHQQLTRFCFPFPAPAPFKALRPSSFSFPTRSTPNPLVLSSRSLGPHALHPDSVRRRCRRGKSRSRPAAVRCRGGRRPTTAATGLGPSPRVQLRPRVRPTAAVPRQTRCWSRSSRHSGGTGDAGSVPFLFL